VALFVLVGLVAGKLTGDINPGLTGLAATIGIRGLWWLVEKKEDRSGQG
jgi:hypothetical protein